MNDLSGCSVTESVAVTTRETIKDHKAELGKFSY